MGRRVPYKDETKVQFLLRLSVTGKLTLTLKAVWILCKAVVVYGLIRAEQGRQWILTSE